MKPFWISDIRDRHGMKTIYINPLPEKHCTFDCVFCPIEVRTAVKTEESFHFDGSAGMLKELENALRANTVDQVFIMPDGEGLANAELADIIAMAKKHHAKVKIITNGYLLNHPLYKDTMLSCDEIIGELMTIKEDDFQKLQRPVAGYTLQSYVENMIDFCRVYKGEFNLSITLLKKYSDSDEALEFFKEAIKKLKPKHVYIETPEEGKLQEAFGVDAATAKRFEKELNDLI